MSEPFTTILREIRDNPNSFSLYVIASWCDKTADELERLTAENERLEEELDNERALGIHTCHSKCQRPLCVLRRENERLREVAGAVCNDVRMEDIAVDGKTALVSLSVLERLEEALNNDG